MPAMQFPPPSAFLPAGIAASTAAAAQAIADASAAADSAIKLSGVLGHSSSLACEYIDAVRD